MRFAVPALAKHVCLRQSESRSVRAMPVTTLSPSKSVATHLSAHRSRRPRGFHLFAPAIGILLLAPHAVSALELGEASIKNGLGESLLVEIPYRLAGNEQVVSACVGVAPARGDDDLPTYARVTRISVTPTHIQIFDDRRVLEPLIGLNVEVHCAGAPHFVRSYQLFVDPPAQLPTLLSSGPAVAAARTQLAIDATAPISTPLVDATPIIPNQTATIAATTDSTATAAIAKPASASGNASARARGLEGGNLPQGQTYRVVRGDTLSGIAARIAGRPVTILEAADAIFAANPAAFSRGNPDLIEEGRSITIPNLMPSQAALAVLSAPAPAAVREAALSAAAPEAVVEPAPAPSNAALPLQADDAASVAAPEATQPLSAATTAVAQPSAAPVVAPTSADVAPDVPSPAVPSPAVTARFSASFVALLALVAAIILASAVVAFVRRRRDQQAAAQASGKVQEPLPRRPVELASRMEVVEGSLTGTHATKQAAALPSAAIAAVADSGAAVPPDLNDVAQAVGPTDAVDFNVGAPVVTNERADESDRAYIIDARDDTLEESFATARIPDVATEPTVRRQGPTSKPGHSEEPSNDEQHAMTIVALDMLRQDYETEHTLTQQASQELRDAVADLQATKAAHTATAETATLESPQVAQDATADSPTARVRAK